MQPNFIPNRHARFQIVSQQLSEAGLSHHAQHIARIVPDLFLLHAVFVDPKRLELEIVNNSRVFLRYSDFEPLYLGSITDSGSIRAREFWNTDELLLNGNTLCEAADYDLEAALCDYDRSKWFVEFSSLQYPYKTMVVDIAAALREFQGEAQ